MQQSWAKRLAHDLFAILVVVVAVVVVARGGRANPARTAAGRVTGEARIRPVGVKGGGSGDAAEASVDRRKQQRVESSTSSMSPEEDKEEDRKDETGRTGMLPGLTVSANRRVNRSLKVILSTAFLIALVEKGLFRLEAGDSIEGVEVVEVAVDSIEVGGVYARGRVAVE